jgi:putative two-component system response regulator
MINTMSNEMIFRLTKAAESKEFGTGEHIVRIGLYASEIAELLGMNKEFIELITFASPMHDLGKIGIPDNILLKPGELTFDELNIMKRHTLIGENILSKSSFPKIQLSASIALNHHERWDGTGYPRGLKGKEIPVEARIVMVCDIYDAMRSARSYKPAFDHHKAAEIIIGGDERTRPEHFDPDVLQAFIQLSPKFELIYSLHQTSNAQSSSIGP